MTHWDISWRYLGLRRVARTYSKEAAEELAEKQRNDKRYTNVKIRRYSH